tara:strand:+ start:304 stop:486 length:183 start_codon:yes stop_codon:yes gene_type:complete
MLKAGWDEEKHLSSNFMNEEQCNSFCYTLQNTTYVTQWDGSQVWKIGGKVFTIASWKKKI